MNENKVEKVDAEPFQNLLRSISYNKSMDLDTMFDELMPVFEIDRESERILFEAVSGNTNKIRMGLKGSIRLEAHSYATAAILKAFSTPGFAQMETKDRNNLFTQANNILTWVVGVELQPFLVKKGYDIPLESVLPNGVSEMPNELKGGLSKTQQLIGFGFFRNAFSFILLHELGHLHHRHTESTPENERIADRFAAEWMCDAADDSDNVEANRLEALMGIVVALIWLTIFNFYFGRKESRSHPEGYDRLFQVLDHVIDSENKEEYEFVWYTVSKMIFIHSWAAGFDFDPEIDAIHMQGDPKEEVNHLIDRISNQDRKK